MENNIEIDIFRSALREAEDGMKEAQLGQLNPHRQEHIRRALIDCEEMSCADPQLIAICLVRLEAAIAGKEQISDREYALREAQSMGMESVFYYDCADYWTMMEILKTARKDQPYSAAVYIDKEAAGGQLHAYAGRMARSLRQWAAEQGLVLPDREELATRSFREEVHFESVAAAVEYILLALAHPEEILC